VTDPANPQNASRSDGEAGAPSGAPAGAVPVVELRGLTKSFGGAQALDDVALTILPREVHGLLGENGSGKSTLIKILAGYHAPDAGTFKWNGTEVSLPLSPGQFRELGLAFVHQDLGLITELTALENLRMVDFAASRTGGSMRHINWGRERARACEAFERYGVQIRPDAQVNTLSDTDRARLAIVRALEQIRHVEGTGLLILDEPTVFLPKEGTEDLFRLVREVVAEHASVLFVSHDLDEVREVTDRVTVLRDGRVHGTVVTADASEAELVEMIIGRRLEQLDFAHHHDHTGREIDASVMEMSGGNLAGVSFDVHKGEILGIAGLMGSGFEDVPYLLFGANPARGGKLAIDGAVYDLAAMTPARALAADMALLPGDRQGSGSVGTMSVGENVMLQVLERYGPLCLKRRRMRDDAGRLLDDFDVRPSDPQRAYHSLSGGNQQKALLAKWLQTKPRLILLHEPTQGVDIGARQQIFGMLREAADEGMAVICASSDNEQLAQICDRVLVVARGKIVRELRGADITKERIAEQVYNSVTLAEASAGVRATLEGIGT
jgi:ribose transport system ATP-binding protein